jgi:hypothetical protein
MFHAKYLSSTSLGFLKEDILSFFFWLLWQRWTDTGRKAITKAHHVPL